MFQQVVFPRRFGFLLLIGLLIAGCRTDPKEKTAAETVKEKFTVTSRLEAEPDRLSPILTYRNWSLRVATLIIPQMAEYDPFTRELSPILLKNLPTERVVEEGPYKGFTAYDFEFLDEAVWDNGEPLTVDDYIFSLKVIFNPKITVGVPVYRSYFSNLKDVVADSSNPKKFTVYSEGKYNRAKYIAGAFYLYPEYHFDPDGLMKKFALKDLSDPKKRDELAESSPELETFAKQFTDDKYSRDPNFVQGCGPYKLVEWVEGERLVLQKKENWWGDKLAAKNPMLTANPDRIVFRPIADAIAAISLIKSKEVEIMGKVPSATFLELQEDESVSSNYYMLTPPTTLYNYMGINATQTKLRDKEVRQALAYCMNTDEIIKSVANNLGQKTIGPIPPFLDYYNNKLEPYSLNVEKAKTLLAEAGWKDTNGNGIVDKKIGGKTVELKLDLLTLSNNIPAEKIAVLFKTDAQKAGIGIEIVVRERRLLLSQRNKGDYDLLMMAAGPDLGIYDPRQSWHSESAPPAGSNHFGFGTAQTDKLIEDIRTELDKSKRDQMMMQFQEILHDEVPVIFLYNSKDRILISKRFKEIEGSMRSPGVFENYLELK